MLWMDVSIGAFKLRDQGLYSIWRTSLYSLLFFLSLPFCSDVATLCWQSLTVTFPLITPFHSPTLSMLSLMCCCCFLLSLSLIYYIYLVFPIFIYLFHFLLILSAVMCCSCAGRLAQAVQFSSATDPVINIKPSARVCSCDTHTTDQWQGRLQWLPCMLMCGVTLWYCLAFSCWWDGLSLSATKHFDILLN